MPAAQLYFDSTVGILSRGVWVILQADSVSVGKERRKRFTALWCLHACSFAVETSVGGAMLNFFYLDSTPTVLSFGNS